MDRSPPPRAALQKQYLIAYNGLSALLWSILLGRVLLLLGLAGPRHVHAGVGQYAQWTQTVAVLEILHSAFRNPPLPAPPFHPCARPLTTPSPGAPTGLVRSPLLTTTIQVFSRVLLVWGIVAPWPAATGPSPFYSGMLLAWAVTEVIRYSYFVANLRGDGDVPPALVWLRYNTFYVLYPLGIGCEMGCVYLASRAARSRATKLLLWDVLVLYVPAGYVMYTHMMKQRRKVIRGKQPERRRGG
ncbi:hypothetical protein MMC26_003419 [Xylographa opegraphella]|nr:hypothetical protein [Xylographa opegraphella]